MKLMSPSLYLDMSIIANRDVVKNQNRMANLFLIDCVGVYYRSTLVGHFVSSPREREKRDSRRGLPEKRRKEIVEEVSQRKGEKR